MQTLTFQASHLDLNHDQYIQKSEAAIWLKSHGVSRPQSKTILRRYFSQGKTISVPNPQPVTPFSVSSFDSNADQLLSRHELFEGLHSLSLPSIFSSFLVDSCFATTTDFYWNGSKWNEVIQLGNATNFLSGKPNKSPSYTLIADYNLSVENVHNRLTDPKEALARHPLLVDAELLENNGSIQKYKYTDQMPLRKLKYNATFTTASTPQGTMTLSVEVPPIAGTTVSHEHTIEPFNQKTREIDEVFLKSKFLKRYVKKTAFKSHTSYLENLETDAADLLKQMSVKARSQKGL